MCASNAKVRTDAARCFHVCACASEMLFGQPLFMSKTEADLLAKLTSPDEVCHGACLCAGQDPATNPRGRLLPIVTEQIRMPERPGISSGACALLGRLLQRDPDRRIDFMELFTDPYLDLAHRPCTFRRTHGAVGDALGPHDSAAACGRRGGVHAAPDCIKKGTALAHHAVRMDESGASPAAALLLYRECIAYITVAARCMGASRREQYVDAALTPHDHSQHWPLRFEDETPARSQALTAKCHEYVQRAEELQDLVNSGAAPRTATSDAALAEARQLIRRYLPPDPAAEASPPPAYARIQRRTDAGCRLLRTHWWALSEGRCDSPRLPTQPRPEHRQSSRSPPSGASSPASPAVTASIELPATSSGSEDAAYYCNTM